MVKKFVLDQRDQIRENCVRVWDCQCSGMDHSIYCLQVLNKAPFNYGPFQLEKYRGAHQRGGTGLDITLLSSKA